MRWSRGLYHMIGRNRSAILMGQGVRGLWMLPWASFMMFRKLMLVPFAVAAAAMIVASPSTLPLHEIAAAGAIVIGVQLIQMIAVVLFYREAGAGRGAAELSALPADRHLLRAGDAADAGVRGRVPPDAVGDGAAPLAVARAGCGAQSGHVTPVPAPDRPETRMRTVILAGHGSSKQRRHVAAAGAGLASAPVPAATTLQPGAGGPTRGQRAARSLRLLAAGVLCWGVLLGGAGAVILIRNHDAAAARRPLGTVDAQLTAAPASRLVGVPDAARTAWSRCWRTTASVPPGTHLTVSRTLFAQQMMALHLAGFHSVSIEQYARFARSGDTSGLPSNPILITFDDGRLDSYRGADQILAARHGYRAVMFVVASWPDSHPQWALHWNELVRMQQSGRWQIQEHAGAGHTFVPIDGHGTTGEFYAYREWKNGRLESFASYQQRVSSDVAEGERTLRQHIPGFRPLAFAVPYSNYGQRFTNDPRIPGCFLAFPHTQFPVVVDGDYLDEGRQRPSEIKGRWSRAVELPHHSGAGD